MSRDQSLSVFEPAQFLDRRHRDMAVRANPDEATCIEPGLEWKQAVTEIGFGGRAKPHGCTGRCESTDFLLVDMRGMHEAPTGIDRRVVEQPFDRTCIAHGETILHFTDLLGDMDMDRHHRPGQAASRCGHPIDACQHGTHGIRGNCTQGMQGHTDAQMCAFKHAQAFEQAQIAIHIVGEAPLALAERPPVKAAGHIQGRQQGQTNPSLLCRVNQGQRHRRGIGIGFAIRLMVQVVKLAHVRVTGLEHLDIQLGRNGAQIIRADFAGKRIHDFTPGPETVRRITPTLCKTGHRALERMRMQIRHTRYHPLPKRFRAIHLGIEFHIQ